jgi:short-subunit dehydrogenase
VELKDSGVQVVTICPGYIKTPMTDLNPYPMPFILEAEDAAKRIAGAIESGKSFTVIPWQMGLVGRIMKMLPNWLYDLVFKKAPYKPRNI